ncbi:PLP-dependent transferase [Lophiostoma macrostomum CBS 122681]|uniref:PLP-dependent transferase n=1 Tax=Lophiostoma macrostomum CBS 122681 TaxID=1314788 RepID=A0A6A6T8K1_9PLEO|nr:PLP-dependent transferase [Lophiostoma macrostomum CBS 122681]
MTSDTLTVRNKPQFGRQMKKEFLLAERFQNLNHGSFGTHPRAIQSVWRGFQDELEARPDYFIRWTSPRLMDESRAAAAKLLKADVNTLVLVPNATMGVNTILRNLEFQPGDKILYFEPIYPACGNTVEYIASTTPAEGLKIEFSYPVEDDWLVDAFRKVVKKEKERGNRVKIAIFDTVGSMPGVRMPFEELTKACHDLGVLSLVDAAHCIGAIEVDLKKLDPDFFVTNVHKWLMIPRACAVLHVALRNQALHRSTLPTSRPLPTSLHITNSEWVNAFHFVGTQDYTPYYCIPAAVKWRESIGGEKAIMSYCENLAKDAGKAAAEILGTEIMDNSTETMTKCPMSNTRLPLSYEEISALAVARGMEKEKVAITVVYWISQVLVDKYDTFMAILFHGGSWWVRWSGQIYLELADFEWGANVLKELCVRVQKGDFIAPSSKL